MAEPNARITEILAGLGDRGASRAASVEELLPLVYPELRRMAHRFMSRERPGHTLQPTALVHDAYLKLVDQKRVDWRGRTHFYAVGARVMRRLLVDHARERARVKRGGDWRRVTLADAPLGRESGLEPEELLSLNQTLEKLATLDARQARLVELRFFGGLSVEEAAEVLGVSKRTLEDDWTHARAWLKRELSRAESGP